MHRKHNRTRKLTLRPIAEASGRLVPAVVEIVIPSLRLGISERVTHAAVSLDEGCVALEHQRPGRQVGIVPATVADGTRIVHHGYAEARLDRLRTGRVDVIHGKTVERIALVIVASDRHGYEQQVRLRQVAECHVIVLR